MKNKNVAVFLCAFLVIVSKSFWSRTIILIIEIYLNARMKAAIFITAANHYVTDQKH